MKILVIDGQGGKLGAQLVKTALECCPDAELTAVGTNSAAAAAMKKAGAPRAATGENAVLVACRRADVILGPIGIVIADALLGEVTPAMAVAAGQSAAVRILLPVSRCETLVAGVAAPSVSALLEDAGRKLAELKKSGCASWQTPGSAV
ncbi:MAG: DUF3842 family protein [Oscillibacter sp.]|jgi:hypothetical protein|nr:DUF3842 family protein [Oscillibacter sp.]